MNKTLSRAGLALSLVTALFLSGCAAALIPSLFPAVMIGAQVAGSYTSGGVSVKFADKEIDAAKNQNFGAGATKVAVWPAPALTAKMAVRQVDTLRSYKSPVAVVSPSELAKALRLYKIEESLEAKTETDLASDFSTLCANGVADVFVASVFDISMRSDKRSNISTLLSLGVLARKNDGIAKTTLYHCQTAKLITLSGEIELESGMNAPEQGEIAVNVGEVIAKVVGGILKIAPLDTPSK